MCKAPAFVSTETKFRNHNKVKGFHQSEGGGFCTKTEITPSKQIGAAKRSDWPTPCQAESMPHRIHAERESRCNRMSTRPWISLRSGSAGSARKIPSDPERVAAMPDWGHQGPP